MGRSDLTRERCSPAHLFALPSATPEQVPISSTGQNVVPTQQPPPSLFNIQPQFQSPLPPIQPPQEQANLVPGYPHQVQNQTSHFRDTDRSGVDSRYIEAQQSAIPFPTGDIPSGPTSYPISFIPRPSHSRPIAPAPPPVRYPPNPSSFTQSIPPPLSLLPATATVAAKAAVAAAAAEITASVPAPTSGNANTQPTTRVTPYKASIPSIERKHTTPQRNKSTKDTKKKFYVERSLKAAATRKAKKQAREKQQQEQQQVHTPSNNMARGQRANPKNLPKGPFREGDRVLCSTSDEGVAKIVKISDDKSNAYIHFVERDRRMDRWVPMTEIFRAPRIEDDDSRLVTRSRMRRRQESNPVSEKEVGNEAVARAEREREEATKVKNVSRLVFGMYELEAWYYAPFYGGGRNVDCVYMCQHCLKYDDNPTGYYRHMKQCSWIQPPGALIYDYQGLKVYEIDGIANIAYCQCLTLLGKLFLDHKTLFFDVAPFLFYVLTYNGEVAGFFSKEKPERNAEFNLACLLTLPHYQKKGLGRFLIQFSYELSRRDMKPGSPERPLSDLGQVSYRSYWKYEILKCCKQFRNANEPEISVDLISQQTGIRATDVIETLKTLKLLKIWKGFYSANLEDHVTLSTLLCTLKEPKILVSPERLRKPNPFVPRPPGTPKPTKKKPRPLKRNSSVLDTPSPRLPPALRNTSSQAITPPTFTRTRTPQWKTPQQFRNRFTTPSPRRTTPPRFALSNEHNEALIKAVADFCNHWSFSKVIAPVDSDNGLPKSYYTSFSKNNNIPERQARDLIKTYAHRKIMAQHGGNSRGSTSRSVRANGTPSKSPMAINRPNPSTPVKNVGKMETAMKLQRKNTIDAVNSTPTSTGVPIGAKNDTHVAEVMKSSRRSGAKDVNHVAKVMAVKHPISTGGMARGKMVSGLVSNHSDDDDTDATDSGKIPKNKNSSLDVVNLISDESEQPTLTSVATVSGHQTSAA